MRDHLLKEVPAAPTGNVTTDLGTLAPPKKADSSDSGSTSTTPTPRAAHTTKIWQTISGRLGESKGFFGTLAFIVGVPLVLYMALPNGE